MSCAGLFLALGDDKTMNDTVTLANVSPYMNHLTLGLHQNLAFCVQN